MRIKFDKIYDLEEDEISLFDLHRREILPIVFGCRIGQCGICKIKILKGLENINKKTKAEKSFTDESNERLACQCLIKGDIEIEYKRSN